MSTKTHLIITERPDTFIEIITTNDRPAIIVSDNNRPSMAYFTPEQAAPIALAALRAAGHEGASSSSCLMQAYDLIVQHVKEAAEKAKEAADREALEGEAFELYKALNPDTVARSVNNLWPAEARDYLQLARRAREIHGATK